MTEASLKDQGNDEYRKGNFLKAAGLYTKGIREDPDNAVLYSNRCAALLKLTKITRAMEDAEACIRLKPDWDKGYFRKGSVHEAIEQYKEALECYQLAQRKNPDNAEVSAKVRTLQKYMKTLGKQQAASEAATTAARGDTAASAASGGKPKPSVGSAAGSSGRNSSKPAAGDASASAGSGSSMAPLAGPVADFVEEWMSHVVGSIKDGAVSPSVHFLPGSPAEPLQDGEDNIRASNAFDAPGVLQEFCNFLSGMWRKLDARALVAIVPKSAISFPEVWRKAGWPCGDSDGVFFQLISHDVKAVLIIPVQDGTPRPPIELGNDFGILPWALAPGD